MHTTYWSDIIYVYDMMVEHRHERMSIQLSNFMKDNYQITTSQKPFAKMEHPKKNIRIASIYLN